MKHGLHSWADVFVFGSALRSNNPSDLDLLVVYDPVLCPTSQARDRAEQLASSLACGVNLPRHVVVLSKSEERSVAFIRSEGCIGFSHWLQSWTIRHSQQGSLTN